MARRIARAALVVAASATAFAFACVDLFHSTDFKTLCTEKPTDPACGGGGTEAGMADSSTDAGPKPEIDFCKLTPAEAKERAIRTCAFLGACDHSIETNAFGECVSRAQLAMDCVSNPTLRPAGTFEKLWKCLAGVTSCADVDACVFGGPRQDCADLDASIRFTQCTTIAGGNVRIECRSPGGGANTRYETCVLSGQRCTESGESVSTCTGVEGYGTCTTSACNGTSVVGCQLGTPTLDRGLDCASVGAGACVNDALGPTCAPGAAAKPCDDGGVVATCDDAGTARACVSGKEIAIDCKGLGLACDDTLSTPTWDPAARCIAESRAPCAEPLDKCAGDDLRGCAKGEVYTAKCSALGLGKCAEVNGHATCAKP